MGTAGLQGSLFEEATDEPACADLASIVVRRTLTDGAWVDIAPGWIAGASELHERLTHDVPWRGERRAMYDRVVDVPRLLCQYGEGVALPHPLLTTMRDALSAHYRPELPEGFATAGLCLYRNGSDSVAWHGDTIGRGSTEDTMVAIVSLGSPRPLMLRPRGGGPSRKFVVAQGDLLVMGGSCQRTWEHAVPKVTGVGPRISVQFRPTGVW